jgi:acetyl-CoA synthetase
VVAFVILRGVVDAATAQGQEIVQELRNHVGKEIGPIAKPRSILVVPELPKTRSGKIMRRLLRDISEKRQLGDVTTLANQGVVDELASLAAEAKAAEDD